MKAIVAGATGLTGSTLVLDLLAKDHITEIICPVRKIPDDIPAGVGYILKDFDMIGDDIFTADAAFSCLGTTMKKAGSKENFFRVDYYYNLMFAEACRKNGIDTFVLQSAVGANSRSAVFYNRVKGELEDAVINLGFSSLTIIRPSLIEGDRSESRPAEKVAQMLMPIINPVLAGKLRRYRSVHVDKIASAMSEAAILKHPGVRFIENEEILSYS